MAQYKVPQDVEAEDKLLGPFTFRQFVYLLIAGGGAFCAWLLFGIFPFLAIIPIPFVAFFAILALPLRKDQPMETYLAAVVSFYLKPNKRLWTAGQRESTILITAPKQTEKPRTRDITEEEAGHRLSFLADLVDTEGYSIRNSSAVRDEYVAEANATTDMLDSSTSATIGQMIAREQSDRHAEIVNQMRLAIDRAEEAKNLVANPTTSHNIAPLTAQPAVTAQPTAAPEPPQAPEPPAPHPAMLNLANNSDYSVETIQKEANRLNKKSSNEVYISLH